MADTPIIQRIVIQGGKEVEAALNSIGTAGDRAFARIQASAAKASAGTGNLDGLTNATKGLGNAAAETAGSTSRLAGLLDTLGATSREAGRDARNMGRNARDAAAGMGRLSDDSDQAGKIMGATDISAIRLGQSIRLIGRAAGVQELSRLGRGLSVLGRAFSIAAPALLVAGLGFLAGAASTAAEKIQDLAAKNLVSNQSFQQTAAAFTAIGATIDDAGRSFDGLNNLIRSTASNTQTNENNFHRMAGAIDDARKKSAELSREFININRTATRAFEDIRRSQRSVSEQFQDLNTPGGASDEEQQARKLRDLSEQRIRLIRDLNDARRKQFEDTRKILEQQEAEDKKIRETRRAMQEAREEAERNTTALQRLGITATDANGRLRTVPGVLEEIAAKLSQVTDSEKRERIEQELVAAGLERRLLPALRQGVVRFRELQEEGKRLRLFQPGQLQILDEFGVALGRMREALLGLRDSLGAAVAPAFIALFNQLTEAFVAARPALTDLVSTISSALKPVLQGIVTTVTTVVTAVGTAFQEIANLINAVFRTNLTGPQIFAAALLALAVAFGGLPATILLVTAAIGKLIELMDRLGAGPATRFILGIAATLGVLGGAVLIVIKVFGNLLRVLLLAGQLLTVISPAFRIFISLFTGIGGIITRAVVAIALFVASIASIPVIIAIVIGAAAGFFAVWAFQNWDKISKFAKATWDQILRGAQRLWDGAVGIFQSGVDAVAGFFANTIPAAATQAWESVKAGASALWSFILNVFSTNIAAIASLFTVTIPQAASSVWEAVKSGAADLWAFVTALFETGVSAIVNFFTTTIPEAGRQAWDGIVQGAQNLWTGITALFVSGVALVVSFFTVTIPQAANAAWDAVKAGAQSLWDGIIGFFQSGIDKVIGFFTRLRDFAVGVWNAIAGAARAAASAQDAASGTGGAPRFSGGGQVFGPGTSTSDSVPALLSAGEFVQRAKAVRFYGLDFMRAVNGLRLPKDLFKGFNMGGLVERLSAMPMRGTPMRFAAGGPVPSGGGLHPVTIDLGNGQAVTGLKATGDTVRELQRAATARSVASAGRKPSFYGKGR